MAVKKVLVAEDNWPARKILERFLTSAGHTVVSVGNGLRAWEFLYEGGKCDVIISDHEMPGMTGVELLRLVKASKSLAHIPFFLMSGALTVSEKDQTSLETVCAKLGATFVAKPADYETLVAQISG